MFNLCKYKDIIGAPGTGIHSIRLFNIAIIDVLATIFLAILLKIFLKKVNFLYILFFVFFLGILIHRMFCVKTTIDQLLFKDRI
mgnify:FL=1